MDPHLSLRYITSVCHSCCHLLSVCLSTCLSAVHQYLQFCSLYSTQSAAKFYQRPLTSSQRYSSRQQETETNNQLTRTHLDTHTLGSTPSPELPPVPVLPPKKRQLVKTRPHWREYLIGNLLNCSGFHELQSPCSSLSAGTGCCEVLMWNIWRNAASEWSRKWLHYPTKMSESESRTLIFILWC